MKPAEMPLLDALALPLAGTRLIEASAGTGKTWTIAALFVRLVLGHGCSPRLPGEILVMTFTKAATRELAERIRERLVQAQAALRAGAASDDADTFLRGLLDAYADPVARAAAAHRLEWAAQAMDEAAILTIDAWCQRMLREHAFDSGCLFDEELIANELPLVGEAVRDYWRTQVYPLQGEALAWVLAHWRDVDALHAALERLWDKPVPSELGEEELGTAVERFRERVAALKDGWAERCGQIREWLDAALAHPRSPWQKRVLQQRHYGGWLEKLHAWAVDPMALDPELTEPARHRLSPAGMREALLRADAAPIPDWSAQWEQLLQALDELPDPKTVWRGHAAARVRARVAELKRQSGRFGFQDLQERLLDALDEARHGERAKRLRERIAAQFPAALIDEFQDTSPQQYAIFERVYRIGLQPHDSGGGEATPLLLLIGDPKQAIYGFRGADIWSYLRARSATQGAHHALAQNHRSSRALVEVINELFTRAEARPRGAFLFGDGFGGQTPLPFMRVAARGLSAELVGAEGALPALTWCVDHEARVQRDSVEGLAASCAERIVALLSDTRIGFIEPGQALKRLAAGDIAVLVRSHAEAETMRRALAVRAVPSVLLADGASVFASPEAGDLLRLLRAVAAPRDMRLVRAALATALLARSVDELLALAQHDELLDAQAERLRALHAQWRTQGVLAMLRAALHAFELPSRWLAAEAGTPIGGERRLTNVLHLAELLQAASAENPGEAALLHWLAERIRSKGLSDEQILRLESDAALVKVVTTHSAKGLQYPLVFLPFAAHYRIARPSQEGYMWDTAPGRERRLRLEVSKADNEAAEDERLRDDLRLLYVALTRAQHALWVGLALTSSGSWQRSAIGCLVSGEGAPGARGQASWVEEVRALAAALPGMVVTEAVDPAAPPTRLARREAPAPLAEPLVYEARFDRQWSIGSYSSLVRDAGRSGAAPVQPAPFTDVLRDDEPMAAAPAAPAETKAKEEPADAPWHRFPRGAVVGNLLHGLMEALADEGFDAAHPQVQHALARRSERAGWSHRRDDLLAWLRALCERTLPPLAVPLRALKLARAELEFWLPGNAVPVARIDALCSEHLYPGVARPALPERTLRGLLMGFADLVFEQGGRYWVLDYKSNAIGPGDASYAEVAMRDEALAHRYDVQAALYLLALHRLLRARLAAAYEPQRHLGGAIFYFLRGVASEGAGCLHLRAPPALIEALDAEFARAPTPEALA